MRNDYILEITLISAQELQKATTFHRMKTYALVWIDPTMKLRTSVDRIGGQNPTWNDKFLFKVSSEFFYSETSGISIEIFDDGILRDTIVGTVRLLVGNVLRPNSSHVAIRAPSFNAVQVRLPFGRFQGVINIGASVLFGSDIPAMSGISAIGFRDLINEPIKPKSVKRSHTTIGISHENAFPDDQSDGRDSTNLSSTSRALKERNRIKELKMTKHARSSSEGTVSGTGSGLLAKKVGRHLPLLVGQSLNDLTPALVISRLAS